MPTGFWSQLRRRAGWMALTAAAVFLGVGGYITVHWRAVVGVERLRGQLVDQIADLARAIEAEQVQKLTFTAEDALRPDFQRLCAQMAAYRGTMGGRGIWGVAPREGRLRFGPSAYPPGTPRGIVPGTLYTARPPVFNILEDGRPFVLGPLRDDLGDYFLAVAAVRDLRSGAVLMVVGLEMEAGWWDAALERDRQGPLLSVVLLAVLLVGGAGAVAWRHRRAPERADRGRLLEAYLIGALGLTLSLVAAWGFEDHQHRFRESQFRQLARADFELVLDAFRDIQTHKLDTLARFFESSQWVDRDEFRRFTAAMTRRRDLQGLAWVQPVPETLRSYWETRARSEGLADFRIWQPGADGTRQPAHGRPVYYPVWYVEPQLENQAVLGYDLGADESRRKALETALATGLPTASEPVRLLVNGNQGYGLEVLHPCFSDDSTPSRLQGFAVASIQGSVLLDLALAGGPGDKTPTVVALYQNHPGQQPQFIAASDAHPEPAFVHEPGLRSPGDFQHAALYLDFPVFAFGRAFTLAVHPSREFSEAVPVGAGWLALGVGLVLTVLATAFTHFILRGRDLLESQVQARTAELRATLYSIGDAVVTADIQGLVRQMNPVAAALTGWSEQEARGRPLDEVLRIGSGRDAKEAQLLARVLGGQGAEGVDTNEAWLMDRHGGRRPIEYSGATIRDERGEFGGVVLVLRDITERLEAQAALHQQNDLLWRIADTSPVGIMVVDDHGRVTFVNGTAEAITGLSRQQLIHRSHDDPQWRVFDFEGNPIKAEHMPFAKVMTAGGGAFLDGEYAIDRPDGRRALLSVNGAPLRDSTGNITGAVFSFTDITAQKQLQESFLRSQKMESVGRLAGGVAHDFNNMLSVINGYSEMLLNRMAPDDPHRAEIEEILGAGRRSESLVRQLLAFARKQTIAPVRLDLNKAVTATLKMLSRIIGEDIRLVWAPKLDIWPVRMDPAQLDQILSNLVVNARDALCAGGKVTIETGTASFDQAYCESHAGFQPGDYVLLAVSDNGCGMDRETLAHLFEPFFTTKPQGKGTGLGLATVYGIVRQNNGFINVYSEPDQGTTFKVYLPRYDEAIGDAVVAPAPQGAPAPTGTETVLLVEDEEALLKLADLLLKKLGYTVLAAATPSQAEAMAQTYEGPIHLLMTDVVMPEMSGRDLWQRLVTLRPGLKCLYMSGYTADIITHHGVLDPGVHFLQKPFQKQVLAAKLREALDPS